jgi:hypothetical protein
MQFCCGRKKRSFFLKRLQDFSAMSPGRDVAYMRLARIFYRREAELIEVT